MAKNSSRFPHPNCTDAVIVAGHAPFWKEIKQVPEHPEDDGAWSLAPFQRGEPPFYIEHIRRGVVHAAQNPRALLIFSGGVTGEPGGWSESETYLQIAADANWWIPDHLAELRADVSRRATTEPFARDSFENILFGLCRFYEVTGEFPRICVVVSWQFKAARFDAHRAALRFPAWRFRFDGFNQPVDLAAAMGGESVALCEFIQNRYGTSENCLAKRNKRSYAGSHPYAMVGGLEAFFAFIEDPKNGKREYPHALPWET